MQLFNVMKILQSSSAVPLHPYDIHNSCRVAHYQHAQVAGYNEHVKVLFHNVSRISEN